MPTDEYLNRERRPPPNTSQFSKTSPVNEKKCAVCDPNKSGDELADQFAKCEPNALIIMGPEDSNYVDLAGRIQPATDPETNKPYFYVVSHGDPQGYKIKCKGQSKYISPKKMAELINKCKYSKDRPILTTGCRTGNSLYPADPDNAFSIGSPSPAQELSDALGRPVTAPVNAFGNVVPIVSPGSISFGALNPTQVTAVTDVGLPDAIDGPASYAASRFGFQAGQFQQFSPQGPFDPYMFGAGAPF